MCHPKTTHSRSRAQPPPRSRRSTTMTGSTCEPPRGPVRFVLSVPFRADAAPRRERTSKRLGESIRHRSAQSARLEARPPRASVQRSTKVDPMTVPRLPKGRTARCPLLLSRSKPLELDSARMPASQLPSAPSHRGATSSPAVSSPEGSLGAPSCAAPRAGRVGQSSHRSACRPFCCVCPTVPQDPQNVRA